MRNAPLSKTEKAALMRILFKHNPPRRRRRFGKSRAGRVIRRRRRAATMRPHRLFPEEWSKLRAIRKAHTERKRAAMAQLASGNVAAAAVTNPPHLVRRWTTDAEWAVVKRGRKAADVPVNIGDQILGSHYKANPARTIRRGKRRYLVITNRSGRKVASFRIKRSRKGRVPARLRRFLFKRGSPRLAKMLRKARAGWRRWRQKQLAKRRGSRKVRRVVRRRKVRKFVFTAARRRALAKARRARR